MTLYEQGNVLKFDLTLETFCVAKRRKPENPSLNPNICNEIYVKSFFWSKFYEDDAK